jgi:hypothetical protein
MRTFAKELPIQLTERQRACIAGFASFLRPRLRLDARGTQTVAFTLDELKLIQQGIHNAVDGAADGRTRRALEALAPIVQDTIQRFFRIDAIPAAARLFQLRISLCDIQPEIWRRIQVKDCTLHRVHEYIQRAMGWEDCHLYRFEVAGAEYMDPDCMKEEIVAEDARSMCLGDVVPENGRAMEFRYVYDFGDEWAHVVRFEGCLVATPRARYPVCLEGERACPPEDVGGAGGYEQYLDALADPQHPEHRRLRAWRGPFDPEEFASDAVTKRLRRGLRALDEGDSSWVCLDDGSLAPPPSGSPGQRAPRLES